MERIPPTAEDRARLRAALAERFAWVNDADVGPRAVEAGECDRCGEEARLVELCGPGPWHAVGRRCAAQIGTSGWCEGHRDDADHYLAVLADLPPDADLLARLWWVASGEVRAEHVPPDALPLWADLAGTHSPGGQRT